MKIVAQLTPRNKGKAKTDVVVYVTPSEALTLIQSLAAQLQARKSNAGRAEFHPTEGADYFTIAVEDEDR